MLHMIARIESYWLRCVFALFFFPFAMIEFVLTLLILGRGARLLKIDCWINTIDIYIAMMVVRV